MRIIDQWNTCDIPYDQTVLAIDEGNVIADFKDRSILIAEYSDIETAKKALSKLRIAYQKLLHDSIAVMAGNNSEYFRFPTEDQL